MKARFPSKILHSLLRTAIIPLLMPIGCLLMNPGSASAQIPLYENYLYLHGDIRTGYFGQMGTNRDGSKRSIHEIRNRTRIGLAGRSNARWEWRIRYAMRFSSDHSGFNPGLHTTAEGNNGLDFGEGAFDMAYIGFRPVPGLLIRAGRFQASFSLPGVINNALIRDQSSNTDIDWTDGIHATHTLSRRWQTDIVAAWHFKNAPTFVMRPPLDINGSSVPFTFFWQLKHQPGSSRIRMAALDVLYSPDALSIDTQAGRSGYLIASVKTVLGWELNSGRELTWGMESAYAFTRPDDVVTGFSPSPGQTGKGAKTGGLGLQTNLSIDEIFPGQRIGFVASWTQPSVLTSPNYWSNQLLAEIRYIWQINRQFSTEIRARYRGDHKKYHAAAARRQEFFPYVRLTYRIR